MQCINCGAEIDNRSKFCPLCGTKQLKWESLVSEEETSVSEAPAEETEAQASEDITRIKKVLEDFYAGEGEETVEEAVEEAAQRGSIIEIVVADVAADVGTEVVEQCCTDIADSTEVQLGDPVALAVEFSGFGEEAAHEAVFFFNGEFFSGHRLFERLIGIGNRYENCTIVCHSHTRRTQ